MTEPGITSGAGETDTGLPAPAPYSKDYWDGVFDQLGKRKLFKLAMAVLALLYGVAIYAPFIGNDRPYVLEAVDYASYGSAQRGLYPVTLSVGRLIREGRDGYEANRSEDSDQTWEQALELESEASATRIATMRASLEGAATEKLDEFQAKLDAAVAAAVGGDAERGKELAGEAKDLAKEIRTEYKALDPERPEEGGLALVPTKSYPLIETITKYEVFFMVLWAFVLTWPLWNAVINRLILGGNRDRIRALRRWKIGGVLLSSLAAMLIWGATIDGSMTFDFAPYKQQLTKGELVAERATFPPIAFGFAEMHDSEIFRPPTWARNAEISEEGFYVRGPQAPENLGTDGHEVPPNPVHVRHAEPDRNAGARHPFGTDSVGRDLMVRMVWGSRVSLSVGLISAALLVLIGTIIGACAGYFGGWVDLVLSRFIEIVLCFPAFFLILMVVAFTDPNVVPPIIAIVVVIACVRWTGVARLTRGEFLRLREQEFTLAAKATGIPPIRTIFRHMLPNAVGPILVAGAFSVASGILTESALSFLGFGVKDPIPSWGSLVNESKSAEHWWIQFFPGFLIFITVVCYNLVGDAIRDAVDPKMKL